MFTLMVFFYILGGNNARKHVYITFIYTETYTEYEYRIQNINFTYEIHQPCQNTSEQT